MRPRLAKMLAAFATATTDDPTTIRSAVKTAETLLKEPSIKSVLREETAEAVQVMNAALSLVHKLTDDLEDALADNERLRSYCDKDLDTMMMSVQAELNTYASCKEAALTYTDQWFAELPFSDDGLKRIATMLITTTEPILGEENMNPVWKEISGGNIATFNRLSELVKGQDEPGSD